MDSKTCKKIVIVGNGVVDILVHPCDETVFETGSYPCENISMSVGGDALNEATILSSFGKEVEWITTLKDDDAGRYILSHCQKMGIDIYNSCFRDYDTAINVVLIKKDGSRHFLVNQKGSLRKLEIGDIPLTFDGDILCFASIFVYPEMKDDSLFTLFSYAKSKHMKVVADMTKCKNQETIQDLQKSLPLIDYLLPNEQEACLFTQSDTVEQAAEKLIQAGVKHVVIKCSEKGCYACDGKQKFWVKANDVVCVDTTGAGDSFVSGFVKALSEEKSFYECCEMGNEFGSLNVQKIGATTWIKGGN
ncbi:carbohydrate kinase family protein [Floccifex porci]|uniref:carbohydrate kinase family protein n=1 Tax=Floccifex porci TaxID=2606629 RepID=UPI00197FCAB9|nr:carbohydrate kinase family protein [Floccifex porci]